MTAIAEPPTTEPLWTRVRASFGRAMAMLGAPAAIAALGCLDRRVRREIVRWLYPLEAIVRRLLLAEAAAIHRAQRAHSNRGPRIVHVPLRSLGLASHSPIGSARSPIAHQAIGQAQSDRDGAPSEASRADPQSWRADFSLAIPRKPHRLTRGPRVIDLWGPEPISRAPARLHAAKTEDPAFRLARRFEALRRVLENPAPYAAKLARLLVREARRQNHLAVRYMLRGSRVEAYDPADDRLSFDVLKTFFYAPEAFEDSS